MSDALIHSYVGETPPPIGALADLASSEGYNFVARTLAEWQSGQNRFDQHNECFMLAHVGDEVVGMCGLNQDPYIDDAGVGRLRHLYVHPDYRSEKLGARLVAGCMAFAATRFEVVRLRTPGPRADVFYDKLGFERSDSATASHQASPGQ